MLVVDVGERDAEEEVVADVVHGGGKGVALVLPFICIVVILVARGVGEAELEVVHDRRDVVDGVVDATGVGKRRADRGVRVGGAEDVPLDGTHGVRSSRGLDRAGAAEAEFAPGALNGEDGAAVEERVGGGEAAVVNLEAVLQIDLDEVSVAEVFLDVEAEATGGAAAGLHRKGAFAAVGIFEHEAGVNAAVDLDVSGADGGGRSGEHDCKRDLGILHDESPFLSYQSVEWVFQ